jgi:transposase-like protein
MVTLTHTITVQCPDCQSRRIVKAGLHRGGNQRYKCSDCHKTLCLNPGTTAHLDKFKNKVLAAVHEGCSQRGVCRLFGISRTTLADWLEKKGRRVARL